MLKVYGRNNSINVQKVMWLVGEMQLVYERLDVGGAFGKNDQDWYLEMNPMGRVPVLDDRGYVLWESHTIVRYLAREYGAGAWYPSDAKGCGDIDKWMDWKIGFLQPALHAAFWGLIRTAEADRDMTVIRHSSAETAKLLAILDYHLRGRDYINGQSISIADVPLGALANRWYGIDVEHPDYQNLRAWYERLCERPAYREHIIIPIT